MTTLLRPDLCVVGAGSAGLSVAAGASQLGVRTVLIERDRMGGDCLNYGCVPSKSLLAAAHAAETVRQAHRFGIAAGPPQIDFGAVHRHVHGVIAAIAPHDSVARFEGLGVKVILAEARFTGPAEIAAGAFRIRARRFVLATGSSPLVPPIPGLDRVPHHTNETIFELTECPTHLLIIGGGAVGSELAQAFRRLGAAVSVVEAANLLSKHDPELVAVLRQRLAAEGIAVHERTTVTGVEAMDGGVALLIEGDGRRRLEGSHLLIAGGRRPNFAGLGLEAAGIAHTDGGIVVDRRLRTSNRRVYAVGDAAGGPQFTHAASYHAGIVVRNALFRWPASVDHRWVPSVTYTDPELAQIGLSEADAKASSKAIRVLHWPLADNDRALAERTTEGLVKIVASRRGKILGVAIAAPRAGELIQPWILAAANGLRLRAIADMIAPYPTLGEASKRAAGSFYAPLLFHSRTRRLVRLLRWLG